MMGRDDYLEEFIRFWTDRSEVRAIRMSFFTPQVGETSIEILTGEMRERAVAKLDRLHTHYPKLLVDPVMLKSYLNPPQNPQECLFARVTRCMTADLRTIIEPCQFGGTPNCSECGCAASMGLHAVSQRCLPVGVKVGSLFEASEKIGAGMRWIRKKVTGNTQ